MTADKNYKTLKQQIEDLITQVKENPERSIASTGYDLLNDRFSLNDMILLSVSQYLSRDDKYQVLMKTHPRDYEYTTIWNGATLRIVRRSTVPVLEVFVDPQCIGELIEVLENELN